MRWVKPETAGKVLGHYRYWTVQFLELYLERCDETALDVPADAYLLAQHAPELARRIRIGDEAGEYESATEKLSGIVMALAVKGSCCRANAELDEASLCFRRAFEGLNHRKAEPRVMAELHRRYAALLAVLKSPAAMDHVESSLECCRANGYSAGEASGLVLRGYIRSETHPADAILDFIEASRVADSRSTRGKRTTRAALQNVIGTVASRPIGLRDQENALRLLQRLKNELKGTPTNVRKLRVLWIEGRLLANLRIDRHAERQLRKARKGFLGLGKAIDYAIVSVELIRFLLKAGDSDKASFCAEETWDQLGSLKCDRRHLEIIGRWTAQKLSVDNAQATLEALLAIKPLRGEASRAFDSKQ